MKTSIQNILSAIAKQAGDNSAVKWRERRKKERKQVKRKKVAGDGMDFLHKVSTNIGKHKWVAII